MIELPLSTSVVLKSGALEVPIRKWCQYLLVIATVCFAKMIPLMPLILRCCNLLFNPCLPSVFFSLGYSTPTASIFFPFQVSDSSHQSYLNFLQMIRILELWYPKLDIIILWMPDVTPQGRRESASTVAFVVFHKRIVFTCV